MINTVTIKDVKVQLGLLCKQKRQIYNMSQEDLAEAVGISRFTVQKFENGKNATLDTVLKIANHFDLLNSLYRALKHSEQSNDINPLY
jgi:DNA-binding XRE family transcriptional regulator